MQNKKAYFLLLIILTLAPSVSRLYAQPPVNNKRENLIWIIFYFENQNCIAGELFFNDQNVGHSIVVKNSLRDLIRELHNKEFKVESIQIGEDICELFLSSKADSQESFTITLGRPGIEEPDIQLVASIGAECDSIPGSAFAIFKDRLHEADNNTERTDLDFGILLEPIDLTGHWEGTLTTPEERIPVTVLLAGSNNFYSGYFYYSESPKAIFMATIQMNPNGYASLIVSHKDRIVQRFTGFVSITGNEINLDTQLDKSMDIADVEPKDEKSFWVLIRRVRDSEQHQK